MMITNVTRTYAPGTEGTALSYASLLHNAGQAGGPVLYMWMRQAFGWRSPWVLSAGASLAYVAAGVGARLYWKLPPDTFMPACAFERRLFGSAAPLMRRASRS